MNIMNTSTNTELIPNKFLGKKIKRLSNSNKSFSKEINKPPSISKSTLIQIEKIRSKYSLNAQNDSQSIKVESQNKFKLPELSLKEQYEDLLNRKELILPPKYLLLLKKQNYLDDVLIDTNKSCPNKENKNHSYNFIQTNFNTKMNMNFNKNDFQQMLFVCPFYYIYQSVNKVMKGLELKYIDIPYDYVQRMNKKYNLTTNFTIMQTPKQYEPFSGEINKAVMEKRKKLFKKILINITLEQHQKFLKENHFENFDPIKSKTWHHKFDLKNVNDIGVYNLVENNIQEYKKLIII